MFCFYREGVEVYFSLQIEGKITVRSNADRGSDGRVLVHDTACVTGR